uniref:Patatin-like phospholipase n=1 Tax=Marseillevirus LCMAC201 TaxID=2506605 RepID=A0A481YW98_9VIRU|nr:MAG: patatin-like phospholipase [Marseillevirus LCMAC201]
MNLPDKFTRLVLSGGGPRGLAILGALHYVDEHKGLKDIQEYWGTSVGSVIILLLLIGYTPFEAFHQFFMLDHFADPTTFDLQSILETSALCPIEIFGQKVCHFIEKKLGKGVDPTFFDLYKQFGKKIHIIGSNTHTMRGECFDMDTRPLMRVIDAIEISCSLPYIFTKKKFEDQTYVDGGFINDYPINMADDGEHCVLGICAFGDTLVSRSDYIGWIYRLLYMPIMELHRERVSRLSDKCTNVELIVDNISMIEMSPSRKKKVEVFSSGYQQARDILTEIEDIYTECKHRLGYQDEDISPDGWDTDFSWSDSDDVDFKDDNR